MFRTNRLLGTIALVALAAALPGCDESGNGSPTAGTPTPPPPAPPPPPPPVSYNVTPCLTQLIPGTTKSVADLVVPDVLTLDLAGVSGFPNGRKLTDPVIDVTLNVIFLKLSTNGPGTLASVPVNPAANDLPFRPSFPYLAAAQGTPPLSGTAGTNFDFRTDPDSAYVRVDRMGMPAVATALVSSSHKNEYNDGNPSDDAAGTFVPELSSRLTTLTNALADDLVGLGLTPCATPS